MVHNLESVLRRVMSLDWREQGVVFVGAVVIASREQFGSYSWRDHCASFGGSSNYEFAICIRVEGVLC